MKFSPDLHSQANAAYIDEMYTRYKQDPASLDEGWRAFFAGFELGWERAPAPAEGEAGAAPAAPRPAVAPAPLVDGEAVAPADAGVYGLVSAYRTYGYMGADTNPLENAPEYHPFLDPAKFGCSPERFGEDFGPGGWRGPAPKNLGDLVAKLKETYCGTFSCEGMESIGVEHRSWVHRAIEPGLGKADLTPEERKDLLKWLVWSEGFETYLGTKYLGQKRFSIEGAESMIPLLETILLRGSELGGEEFCFGMAHRGRLNVLVHTMGKLYQDVLCEFEGHTPDPRSTGDGDVKYHQGYSQDRWMPCGKNVHLSMAPNPSHLELVDPVVEGMVRAKQIRKGEEGRTKVIPIQIHGESAFTGQGLVPETLLLSELPDYTTGGTIHIVVNNQIGFTATARETRFTPYPTDIGRMIHAPIFHVNGDDPEAVVHAAKLAIEFRQKFQIDVLIDLICYRRHGHNETDDPTFTQPMMYEIIQKKETVATMYARRLVAEGVVTEAEVQEMKDEHRARMDKARAKAQAEEFVPAAPAFGGLWTGLGPAGKDWSTDTRVPQKKLTQLGERLIEYPEDFQPHRKLQRLLDTRGKMARGEQPLDWGMAEALAFASLLTEGHKVRLAGQDCQRGTFSHRHAVLHDPRNGNTYTPLQDLGPDATCFKVINSMLSELAVLGFEFGMSWTDPHRLCIWEAQFGDFANGAQMMIDQFISSCESKWGRMSGIVMLLPHGYAGQGPEHSSARLERYLQLCAEENMQVCNLTTPAQYFHVLRRQQLRRFRKPLVIMSPKKLLRYERAVSNLSELAEGGFHTVLDDDRVADRSKVTRIAFCSGKVFYTMQEAREKHGDESIAFVRLEQLYPFPTKELHEVIGRYPNAEDFLWVQEEPKNMGGWGFARWRVEKLLGGKTLHYHGRDEAASTATGSKIQHTQEENALVISIFGTSESEDSTSSAAG